MARLDPHDDWPELDWLDVVKAPADDVKRWLAASPRRALGPAGILLARQRHLPAPGAFVLNEAPPSPDKAIWSLDLIREGMTERLLAPPDVEILSVGWSGEAIALRWRLGGAVKARLGLEEEVETTTGLAALRGLSEPSEDDDPLAAFAVFLEGAGLRGTGSEKLASRRRAATARSEKKTAAAEAALIKKIWTAAPRGRPVPKQLRDALAAAGLGGLEQSIATLARRVISLRAIEGRSVPVGEPRLGGAPDLPLKFAWPEVEGELLSFILQVPVEDTLLALFVGRNDSTTEVEHQVLAVPRASLQRKPVPSSASWRDDDCGLLPPVPLALEEGWQLPPVGSDHHRALVDRHPELGEREAEYQAVCEQLTPGAEPHLFGFAANPELERRHKKAEPLFTVPSSQRAELSFWDFGVLDVLAPPGRRFGRGVVRGTTAAILTS